MTQNVLIIGASSGIAEAVARRYAMQGARIYLVGRNIQRIKVIATDLLARGASDAKTFEMDAHNVDIMPHMLDGVWAAFGTVDVALIAHGTLPDQQRSEHDIEYAAMEFRTNAESVITCMAGVAQRFDKQGEGVIAVVGSVAGDRGRVSNYLYGAAKASIESYASGVRAKLFNRGVHVLTIKPGFVATAMTANLNLPELLIVQPERVAVDIQRAIVRRTNVLYTPWFWRYIMIIIRWMPEVIFKRLKL
jgi:hypothetical protein